MRIPVLDRLAPKHVPFGTHAGSFGVLGAEAVGQEKLFAFRLSPWNWDWPRNIDGAGGQLKLASSHDTHHYLEFLGI